MEKEIDVMQDFRIARDYKKDWINQAKEDFDFTVGNQWDSDDKAALENAGKPALTLNKIQALVFLISGLQRQNRTDFKAFPIGEEDTIKSDAITYLLKDMMRACDGEFKSSEMFEHGIICGEGWLEPYIDYTHDILNGDLMFRACSPLRIFPDPASIEYDKSDASYIIKYTPNIKKEHLLIMFPDKEKEIDELEQAVIDKDVIDPMDMEVVEDTVEEDSYKIDKAGMNPIRTKFNMIEYHYYRQQQMFIVVNLQNKEDYNVYESESDANYVLEQLNERGVYTITKRFMRVPYIKVLVNGQELDDYVNPFYPRYKFLTLFPFYAHKTNVDIDCKELLVQGIVNSLKDPQREINKRRSQELHHLNSSTNSGWLNHDKEGFINKNDVEEYGSTSGVVLSYKSIAPQQIHPMSLSSGHEQMVQLANSDIKEISGINTDLLAMNDKASSSGRAIHLRQQQGLMMVQRILDNFARTRRIIGRFLISQIGEVYTVGKVKRALGEAWLKDHFSEPVMIPRRNPIDGSPMIDQNTGQQEMIPLTKPNGQLELRYREDVANSFIQMVLDGTNIDRYDVVVGDVATSETIKMANYAMLLEFKSAGVPIPPEVIIDESTMSDSTKEKIKRSLANQIAAMQSTQQKK